MRIIFVFTSFCLFLFTSCKQDVMQIEEPASLSYAQRPEWLTENLKPEYLIQFPSNYQGNGMMAKEGPEFYKERADSRVVFSYDFCDPSYCDTFGEVIPEPLPNSVKYKRFDSEYLLDSKVEIRTGNILSGIFYFNNEKRSLGMVYLLDDNLFKEGLVVEFDQLEKQEVFDIVSTIKINRYQVMNQKDHSSLF